MQSGIGTERKNSRHKQLKCIYSIRWLGYGSLGDRMRIWVNLTVGIRSSATIRAMERPKDTE